MNHAIDFWNKIGKLKELEKNFNIQNIQKEDTRKIVRAIQICLGNEEILAGGCCLHQRNSIIRFCINTIIKYFMRTFQKYS